VLRWKGPEAEGEGEEPVVNQNRRSTESPSHLFETVRGSVCVKIVVARDLVDDRVGSIDRHNVAVVLVIIAVHTSIATKIQVVANEDGKD